MKNLLARLKDHTISSTFKVQTYNLAYIKLLVKNNKNPKEDVDFRENAINLSNRYLNIYGRKAVISTYNLK